MDFTASTLGFIFYFSLGFHFPEFPKGDIYKKKKPDLTKVVQEESLKIVRVDGFVHELRVVGPETYRDEQVIKFVSILNNRRTANFLRFYLALG